jgi:hypothetical protein
VEDPAGGRERGPRGLARAWIEVIARPRRFFENGVAPGDQAPGLVFAVGVSLVYVSARFALVPASRPSLFGGMAASVLVGLLVAGLIVAPAALHLVAALQTLLLMALAPERGGVSETVQLLAYAAAPCALAGVGAHPALVDATVAALGADAAAHLESVVAGWRLLCTAWGAGLLVLGTSVVHDVPLGRAAVAAALPALVVFGYLFGGVFAFETVVGVDVVATDRPVGDAAAVGR